MVDSPTDVVTGEPAFAVDRAGRIVLWNQASERAFGYPRSKVIGKDCWQLLCGRDDHGNAFCSEHCEIQQRAKKGDALLAFSASYRTANDEWRRFSVTSLLVSDALGYTMLLHICRPLENPDRQSPAH